MHLSFEINCLSIKEFICHWSDRYFYENEEKYDDNIGKPLTEESRLELFEWKNGSKLSAGKIRSVVSNYPLAFRGDLEGRYLDHKKTGGAIWNIFYLHCLFPQQWPVYDQHTHRAMIYIKTGGIKEIGNTKKKIYESYKNEYIPFLDSFDGYDGRKIDKALFSFGQFLKTAARYS